MTVLISFFWTSPAEAEPREGQRTECPHSEAAHWRVHGEEKQRQEFPFKDPGC